MGPQVMSKAHALTLKTALGAAAEPATPATSGVDEGIEEGARVVKGCVRYAGVTQADYDDRGRAQERPNRLFGPTPKV